MRTNWLVCGIASVITLGVALPSAAATTGWTDVSLGTHRFGHLTTPDAIVARVGADGVGWDNPPEGSANGPWSFDVAADGSVFLLDNNNNRLLVWDPGEPKAPSRTVALPTNEIRGAADLAVGSNGTIYLTYLPQKPRDERKTLRVCALSPSGKLLWTAPTDIAYFNSRLRTVPDGSVYWEGAYDSRKPPSGWWTPVTSPDGKPLSLERQRAGVTRYQPMPGGLRFEETVVGDGPTREWRLTLIDHDDRSVGAWRVTSDDDLGGTVDEPGMVGGDPIVMLEVARQTQDDFLYEYIALRLPEAGGKVRQLSLDPRAVWGDVPVTGLRVGPDGALYQLRSDIDTGVTIARYSLGAGPTPSPTPTPTTSPTATTPGPTSTTAGSGPSSPAPTDATPIGATPITSAASNSAGPLLVGGSLVLVALVGVAAWLVVRRRHLRGGT